MSLILAGALAAGSLLSSVIGGSKSAAANRRAQAQLEEEKAANDAWYRRKYNEDYSETAAGQNMMRMAKDYARETFQKASGAEAVAGGSNEQTQAAKDAGNKMVGNAVANMSADDTRRKDSVDAQYRQSNQEYNNQQIALQQQQASNIAETASGASNALMSGASMAAGGIGKSGTGNSSKIGDISKLQNMGTNGPILENLVKNSQYYRVYGTPI